MYVVLNVLEWVLSAIGRVGSFILSGYYNALVRGELWALVLSAAVVIPAAILMLGGNGSSASGKWCGTCGARGKKHESWCRKGRWGGRQRWGKD